MEGFCRLVVGLDVEDRVSLKSVPFVYCCVKESNSFSEISAVNLKGGTG